MFVLSLLEYILIMTDLLIILKQFYHLVGNIIIIHLMGLALYKVAGSLQIKHLKTIELGYV
jgi:hypothetical protein